MRKFCLILLLCLASIASPQTTPSAARPLESNPRATVPHFEDIARAAGLTISHISSVDKKYIVESMSGGVGFIDCDNDGKLDIVTVNGSSVERYRKSGGDPLVTLYHQDDDLKFPTSRSLPV